ncbi:DUF302 domain-containing protein [Halorussus amylolyticus]|uniref:DUF302 domain-containing protein n=1 Tax=Halorussus amylolyticus TaxID=1126242 RepID=UPI0010471492|nr:DUF302 domain-containing protein [Halorussus amylolyticus]
MREPDRRTILRAAFAGASGLALAGTAAGQETTEGDTTASGDETTTEGGEATTESDETTTGASDDAGLVTVESDDDFETTVERITGAIEGNENLTLVTTVDHAENAESAGLDLPPTTLLAFGNPQLGTQLMQASRSAAIDLPQKMLVWEAEDGSVNVTYNDPAWLADRHGVEGRDEVLAQISGALESLATGGN